ncbi:MAG: sigma-70 family RNA polymerase sigma factor [Gemmatales bacterium]
MPNLAQSTNLLILLKQLPHDESDVRSKIIAHTLDRLNYLTACMFRRSRNLRHMLQTDDIFQDASIRLYHALAKTHPDSVRGFFGLAATNIRWTLADLARKARKQRLQYNDAALDAAEPVLENASSDEAERPQTLLDWAAFHETVETMAPEAREVIELLWYQGLTQEDAAEVLGVSLRTLKRRWLSARIQLASKVDPPDVA